MDFEVYDTSFFQECCTPTPLKQGTDNYYLRYFMANSEEDAGDYWANFYYTLAHVVDLSLASLGIPVSLSPNCLEWPISNS